MLTLRGTPFLYYGEEIGMTDMYLEAIEQFRDKKAIWYYDTAIAQPGATLKDALAYANQSSRDKSRTPMQWTDAPNAGFCPSDIDPWLPVNPNHASGINVADQLNHPSSLLTFYQQMLQLRRWTPALSAGDYVPLHQDSEEYLAFLRRSPGDNQTCLVVLNMSEQRHKISFDLPYSSARVLFSSHIRDGDTDNLATIFVAPFEIYIAELR
jgi:glycosidase